MSTSPLGQRRSENPRPKQQPIDQQWLVDYLTLPKRKKRSKLTEFFGWVLGF
ncbi:hypothetical protein [Corynebacterium sp. NML130628]|uniref:hypothetical protein n=1 Tax=Corynebacterium sp. NML130628 TaxID=1906333 RepID=UPI0015A6F375|nr:hypothetical protein [Corynebacterium sp. NML130628]